MKIRPVWAQLLRAEKRNEASSRFSKKNCERT